MLILLIVGAFSSLLTFVLLLLPCGTVAPTYSCTVDDVFLALPDAIGEAVALAGKTGGWLLGMFGSEVKTEALAALTFTVSVMFAFFLWEVLRRFDVPVLDKYLSKRD